MRSSRYLRRIFFRHISRFKFLILCVLSSILGFIGSPTDLFAQQCGTGDIGGTAFSDYNANGAQDASEPGVDGISVVLINTSGAVVQSVVTDADGTYVFVGAGNGTPFRIEFSDIPSYAFPGPAVGNSDTTVQFVSQSDCQRDLAISNPAKFCNANPLLALPCYVHGDPLGGGASGDMDAFVGFNYTDEGEGQPHLLLSYNRDIGTTWGNAAHRSSQSFFVGAFTKRHTGFGPGGTGAIYKVNVSDPLNPVTSLFVDLNSYPGVFTGADPHGPLPADLTYLFNGIEIPIPSLDEDTFDAVGKIGLGDLDLSEDDQTLWVVNLNQRALHRLDVGTAATAPASIGSYPIPGDACDDATESRPAALKVHKGLVYVGGVCSGENAQANQVQPNLRAYVYQFDPAAETFTLALDMPLNFVRDYALIPSIVRIGADEAWQPWAHDSNDISGIWPFATFVVYPQAMLSDLEFMEDDSMILGFSDRTGHQFGALNRFPAPAGLNDPNGIIFTAPTGGDIMKAEKIGSAMWAVIDPTTEFYNQDDFFYLQTNVYSHREVTQGALALLPLSGEVKTTAFDPLRVSFNVESSGIRTFSNIDGSLTSELEIIPPNMMFGKAAGLGDIELLCDPAPLQVGNRVWFDENQNGIQDAGEIGLAGVTVNLYDSSLNLIDSRITDSQGQFLFSVSPGLSYIIGLDNPSDYATGGTLAPYEITSSRTGSNGALDSDGTVPAGGLYPQFVFTAGVPAQNDHTFDFGFILSPVDCAGTKNGTEVVDECGVCGGTGKDQCGFCPNDPNFGVGQDDCGLCPGQTDYGTNACFACTEADITQDQTTLDQGLKLQEDLINQLLGQIKRLDPSPATVKWANRQSLLADQFEQRGWIEIWTIPSIQTTCEVPAPICVTSNDNAEALKIYSDSLNGLQKIFNKARRRLGRLKVSLGLAQDAKRVAKKKKKKHDRIYDENAALQETIPQQTIVCTQ